MFDLKVTHRDHKTGRITKHEPYKLRVGKNGKTFERPVGSGNLWYENGDPAGQVEYKVVNDKMVEEVKIDAPHVAWVKPISNEEKVMQAMNEKDSKIAKLEADLKALELKAIEEEQKEEIQEAVKPSKVSPKAKDLK